MSENQGTVETPETATVMQINRKAFVKLCHKVGLASVSLEWKNERLVKRFEKLADTFPDVAAAIEEFKLNEAEAVFLTELVDAAKNKVAVEFDEPKAGGKSAKGAAEGNGKAKSKKAPKEAKEKKMSALTAAHTILKRTKKSLTSGELITKMAEQGLWSSPNGKTPAATLSAAIAVEIIKKGKESRFAKDGPGKFLANNDS